MKVIQNTTFPQYYPTFDLPTIVFLFLLGTLLECLFIYICFKENDEIQAIIAITILGNLITFIIGVVFLLVFG